MIRSLSGRSIGPIRLASLRIFASVHLPYAGGWRHVGANRGVCRPVAAAAHVRARYTRPEEEFNRRAQIRASISRRAKR